MLDRTDDPAGWFRAAVLGLLSTPRGRVALLAAAVAPVLLIGGMRSVDDDTPSYLAAWATGAAFAPGRRGFLLEGLLPDALGAALARLGLPPDLMAFAWWALGLVLLGTVLAVGLRRGELAYRHLLLLVAFSHLADTLALWVGKFDPLLMACLLLSAWRRPAPATVGSVLAGFCHPILATLSTAGVVAVDLALGRGFRRTQAGAALLAAGADLALVHRLLPGLVGRDDYVAHLLTGLLHDAALLGAPTLVSAALVPFCLVRHFAGPFRYGGRRGASLLALWAAPVLLVACVLTLDHTRVMTLLSLAPAVAFLRAQEGQGRPESWDWSAFALLFLCRLALAQIDGNGAVAATPYPLAPWVEPPSSP